MKYDEDRRNGQGLQIVQAFSSMEVSEQIIRSADIRELVGGMLSAQDEVGRSVEEVERARRERKGGSLIGNWWKDRDDKLLNAQSDLQKSIGSLSQKSSQLLIINAAISRGLSDQQRTDQLAGSMKCLEQVELQMEALNQQLIASVAEDLLTVVSDWRTRLDDLARDFKERHLGLERKLFAEFHDHIDQVRLELEANADKIAGLSADLERRLE